MRITLWIAAFIDGMSRWHDIAFFVVFSWGKAAKAVYAEICEHQSKQNIDVVKVCNQF